MTLPDQIKALPLGEPVGYVRDGGPEGLCFQREPVDGIAALVYSTAPIYSHNKMVALRDAAASLAAEHDARMQRMVEALKPFAAMAAHFPTGRKYSSRPTSGAVYYAESGGLEPSEITVEDLQAAAAALREHKEQAR